MPTWYLTVVPEIQAFLDRLVTESISEQTEFKHSLYDFFERNLSVGNIALGSGIGQADQDRMRIDTVVIHHTKNPAGLSPSRLSAIELMRLYAPYFANPSVADCHFRGKPISSGHERDGVQVFWPYHWLIRDNGDVQQLLVDSEIGWHAGNWNINCRSVAIALDNDYESSQPYDLVLDAIARLIVNRYPDVPIQRVFGHREVNPKTACPSSLFLRSPTRAGWKEGIIKRVLQLRYLIAG